VLVQELQDKIKAADLAGLKEFEKGTPQEEELAEENPEVNFRGDPNEAKRGEPLFLFVARVSDDERAKALAEAFRKAKRQAARLAEAAGTELGTLRHLDGQSTGVPGDDSPPYYNPYAMRALRALQGAQADDTEERSREAVATQAGPVTYRVAVTAAFALKPGPAK
jgi:hypothetical protein